MKAIRQSIPFSVFMEAVNAVVVMQPVSCFG